ncbi:hypothetical protein LXL04_011357 [Taraxacum kok-saghyz]
MRFNGLTTRFVTFVIGGVCIAALSDAASGVDINELTIPIQELSEVCRRNHTVQEMLQEALRPLELNLVYILSSSS